MWLYNFFFIITVVFRLIYFYVPTYSMYMFDMHSVIIVLFIILLILTVTIPYYYYFVFIVLEEFTLVEPIDYPNKS